MKAKIKDNDYTLSVEVRKAWNDSATIIIEGDGGESMMFLKKKQVQALIKHLTKLEKKMKNEGEL